MEWTASRAPRWFGWPRAQNFTQPWVQFSGHARNDRRWSISEREIVSSHGHNPESQTVPKSLYPEAWLLSAHDWRVHTKTTDRLSVTIGRTHELINLKHDCWLIFRASSCEHTPSNSDYRHLNIVWGKDNIVNDGDCMGEFRVKISKTEADFSFHNKGKSRIT